ncbi:MAG TPA: hypothetical protein VGB55_08480 [Tepidisphaeraceae bacterium]
METNQYTQSNSVTSEVLPVAAKAAAIAAGVGLVYELFRYRRLILTTAVFAGTAAFVNQLAEKARAHKAANGGRPNHSRSLAGEHLGSPSFQGDNYARSSQEPMDELDEAMMESFPASDPPASFRR